MGQQRSAHLWVARGTGVSLISTYLRSCKRAILLVSLAGQVLYGRMQPLPTQVEAPLSNGLRTQKLELQPHLRRASLTFASSAALRS